MIENFDSCVNFTLAPENDGQPSHITSGDPGGATAWGITRATLSRWQSRAASVADVQALTKEEATKIYRAWYWSTVSGDSIPPGADLLVFDHGVVAGEVCSAKLLQGVLRVDRDGQIGPMTIAAAKAMSPTVLVSLLRTAQEQDFRSKADFPAFGNGWLNRLHRRYITGTGLARSASAGAAPPVRTIKP